MLARIVCLTLEQSKSDERIRKKALDCLCKVSKAMRRPQLTFVRIAEQMKDWGSTAFNRSSKQSKKTLLSLVRLSSSHSTSCADLYPGPISESRTILFTQYPVFADLGSRLLGKEHQYLRAMLRTLINLSVVLQWYFKLLKREPGQNFWWILFEIVQLKRNTESQIRIRRKTPQSGSSQRQSRPCASSQTASYILP